MSSHHEDLGGDQTSTVECPGCGQEVSNHRLPVHIPNCDGREDL
jgi:endogenous inhibitor of DNA gyrase (YacG/DUF329 family)